MSMTVSPSAPLANRYTVKTETEAMCLFRCTPNGFPKDNILGIFEQEENGTFSKCRQSFTAILPYETQKFLCTALKNRSCHYVLLLTKTHTPIVVVTSLASLGGICLAIILRAKPETVLSFLKTIPTVSCIMDPAFELYTPSAQFDLMEFELLSRSFRRTFAFFESSYSEPMTCSDPLALFRMLRMKLQKICDAFGITANFLIRTVFDEPPRKDAVIDTDLFSATTLLLLFAFQQYGIEDTIRVVFITVDRCPALCLHFRVDSDRYENSYLLKYVKTICNRQGTYFTACLGEHARKESEKIPGIGHIIRNDRYSAFGDHALNVFSPAKRDWTEYINRSPLFFLPASFYEGFDGIEET